MEMLKKYASIVILLTVGTVMFTGCAGTTNTDSQDGYGDNVDGVNPYGIGGENLGDPTLVDGDIPLSDIDFKDLNPVDLAFSPIYFGYNTFTIPSAEMEKINALADLMISEPTFLLLITGHCDERGTVEYNVSLGEYRAQAIRDVLIHLGVAPERLQTLSMGEEMPADTGHNEAAWKLNRRGELSFFTR